MNKFDTVLKNFLQENSPIPKAKLNKLFGEGVDLPPDQAIQFLLGMINGKTITPSKEQLEATAARIFKKGTFQELSPEERKMTEQLFMNQPPTLTAPTDPTTPSNEVDETNPTVQAQTPPKKTKQDSLTYDPNR